MSDSSCVRQRARSSTFIVPESLFPIKSHGECYLTTSKVPLRVLVESTSRVSPTHYTMWHPCKSQPAKSKSQPANTKVSRQFAGQKGYMSTTVQVGTLLVPGDTLGSCPEIHSSCCCVWWWCCVKYHWDRSYLSVLPRADIGSLTPPLVLQLLASFVAADLSPIYMYIYIGMYVCIYVHVYMYVCMYVCMYVYMYICMYVCMSRRALFCRWRLQGQGYHRK